MTIRTIRFTAATPAATRTVRFTTATPTCEETRPR